MIVHLGVVLIAVTLAASQSYSSEIELRMEEGETATVEGHTLVFEGLETSEDSEKTTIAARIRVDGRVYEPAVNEFVFGGQTIGTPSVSRSEEHTSELQSLMRISYAVFCLKK